MTVSTQIGPVYYDMKLYQFPINIGKEIDEKPTKKRRWLELGGLELGDQSLGDQNLGYFVTSHIWPIYDAVRCQYLFTLNTMKNILYYILLGDSILDIKVLT